MNAASGAAIAGAATVYLSGKSTREVAAAAVDTAKEAKEELQQLVNWSGTHHVRPKRFYQPETTEEVEDIVRKSHEQGGGMYMYPARTLTSHNKPWVLHSLCCLSQSVPPSMLCQGFHLACAAVLVLPTQSFLSVSMLSQGFGLALI